MKKYPLSDHLTQIAFEIQEFIKTLTLTAVQCVDLDPELSRRILKCILLLKGSQILIHPSVLDRDSNAKGPVLATFLNQSLPYLVLFNSSVTTNHNIALFTFEQPSPENKPLQSPFRVDPTSATNITLISQSITSLKTMVRSTLMGIPPADASKIYEAALLEATYILFTIVECLLYDDLPQSQSDTPFQIDKLNDILFSLFHIKIYIVKP